jgi:hypothetical protein
MLQVPIALTRQFGFDDVNMIVSPFLEARLQSPVQTEPEVPCS